MSEIPIQVRVPLDTDGFLRRECPNCGRQFKLMRSTSSNEAEENASAESYYCPYCCQPASSWWTKEQIEYAKQIAVKQVMEPGLQRLQQQIKQLNRPGSFIQVKATLPELPDPNPLSETDDMMQVNFPCHPEKPIKIDETWEQNVACFVCGIQYPVFLVEELPD